MANLKFCLGNVKLTQIDRNVCSLDSLLNWKADVCAHAPPTSKGSSASHSRKRGHLDYHCLIRFIRGRQFSHCVAGCGPFIVVRLNVRIRIFGLARLFVILFHRGETDTFPSGFGIG